jgi:hypothetical protein
MSGLLKETAPALGGKLRPPWGCAVAASARFSNLPGAIPFPDSGLF